MLRRMTCLPCAVRCGHENRVTNSASEKTGQRVCGTRGMAMRGAFARYSCAVAQARSARRCFMRDWIERAERTVEPRQRRRIGVSTSQVWKAWSVGVVSPSSVASRPVASRKRWRSLKVLT